MDTVDVSAKTPAADQDIAAYIEQKQAENRKNRRRLSGRTLLGAGICAAASIIFPPAGIGGFVALAGAVYGLWHGWDLVTESGAARSLELSKKEAQEDPSLAKTTARSATDKKRYERASNVSFGATLLMTASVLTMLLAPAAAAIATPIFLASLAVGLTADVVQNDAKGSYKTADAVVRAGEGISLRKARVALEAEAAQLKAQGPVAGAPSPSASFDKAANSNEPPKPETKDAAPVIKPEAPKL